jgi:hypothetical protein
MRTDHRWLVVFAGNLVFLFVVAQLNHHLTDFPLLGVTRGQLSLFLVGLPLTFAALRLALGPAVLTAAVTALAFEAGTPLPTGAILLPAAACVCVTQALRPHFNRFEPSSMLLAGLIINAVLILAVTLIVAYRGGGVSLTRVAVDLIVSQLALALLSGWFFAAQMALLELFGFNLETELREPL